MSLFTQLFGQWWRREKEVPDESGMDRYPEESYLPGYKPSEPQKPHPRVVKIIVADQYSKEQLLLAIEHLHYGRDTDTGYMAVNELVHLYQRPELIEVQAHAS